MTTRREVPFTGDSIAWVHSELADIKAKLALVQSAADQSRSLATDAAEPIAHRARVRGVREHGHRRAAVAELPEGRQAEQHRRHHHRARAALLGEAQLGEHALGRADQVRHVERAVSGLVGHLFGRGETLLDARLELSDADGTWLYLRSRQVGYPTALAELERLRRERAEP